MHPKQTLPRRSLDRPSRAHEDSQPTSHRSSEPNREDLRQLQREMNRLMKSPLWDSENYKFTSSQWEVEKYIRDRPEQYYMHNSYMEKNGDRWLVNRCERVAAEKCARYFEEYDRMREEMMDRGEEDTAENKNSWLGKNMERYPELAERYTQKGGKLFVDGGTSSNVVGGRGEGITGEDESYNGGGSDVGGSRDALSLTRNLGQGSSRRW